MFTKSLTLIPSSIFGRLTRWY